MSNMVDMSITYRWNFEATSDQVFVCYNDHNKGNSCEFEPISTSNIVELLEGYRSEILKLRIELAKDKS